MGSHQDKSFDIFGKAEHKSTKRQYLVAITSQGIRAASRQQASGHHCIGEAPAVAQKKGHF